MHGFRSIPRSLAERKNYKMIFFVFLSHAFKHKLR